MYVCVCACVCACVLVYSIYIYIYIYIYICVSRLISNFMKTRREICYYHSISLICDAYLCSLILQTENKLTCVD